jgi:hypothetical protein
MNRSRYPRRRFDTLYRPFDGRGTLFRAGCLHTSMSTDRQPEPAIRRVDGHEGGDRPEVPAGVLHGIQDLADGRTVDEDDLDELLSF